MKVLVTGGAGYIGSTIASACIDAGIHPVILDDLTAGLPEFVAGRTFYRGDIASGEIIDRIAAEHSDLSLVIHCAARTIVPQSVAHPLDYYEINVAKTVQMMRHLRRNGIRRVVFSSSASVYAAGSGGAVTELAELRPSSPYARTKAMIETVLTDSADAGELRAISLRYFNPIGADPQLRTGQQSRDPSHVLGRLMTAYRSGEPFVVTGTDWQTRDGSGLRDFVHVWDLARAHVAAIERFQTATESVPYRAINVGGGSGTTVFELVRTFERVVGGAVDIRIGERRPGDVAGAYADPRLAASVLGWSSELSLFEGISDALAWQEVFSSRRMIAPDELRVVPQSG